MTGPRIQSLCSLACCFWRSPSRCSRPAETMIQAGQVRMPMSVRSALSCYGLTHPQHPLHRPQAAAAAIWIQTLDTGTHRPCRLNPGGRPSNRRPQGRDTRRQAIRNPANSELWARRGRMMSFEDRGKVQVTRPKSRQESGLGSRRRLKPRYSRKSLPVAGRVAVSVWWTDMSTAAARAFPCVN